MDCIIEKYYDEILKYCMYETRKNETAYDLTQETFYRFIRSVEHYEHRNLRAYLYAIARNICIDHLKRQRYDESFEALARTGKSDGRRRAEIATNSLRQNPYHEVEDKMVLTQYLSELPQKQREVVILRYYGELKFSEIAEILEISPNTAKTRLYAAISQLKKYLREHGQ